MLGEKRIPVFSTFLVPTQYKVKLMSADPCERLPLFTSSSRSSFKSIEHLVSIFLGKTSLVRGRLQYALLVVRHIVAFAAEFNEVIVWVLRSTGIQSLFHLRVGSVH